MSPLHSRDPQNKGGQNQKWVPHPCLLGSPKKGENATSPLHAGSPELRGQNQKWLNWGQGQNFGCAVQKNTTQKIFAEMVCLGQKKNTLKNPPQSIFKGEGGSKTPHAIGFFINPPPCWGWGAQEGKEAQSALQIITRWFNDPHSAININNAQHIVDKIWTLWGEGNIRKRTPVIHHQVCEVQAVKTTRPTTHLEYQGPLLGG